MSVDGCGHVQLGDDCFRGRAPRRPGWKACDRRGGSAACWRHRCGGVALGEMAAVCGEGNRRREQSRVGDAPSVHAAFTFTQAYGLAVWQALVAALLIGAAVQTVIPRTWLLRVLNRRGLVAGAVVGGLASTPSRCVHAALRRWRPRCGAAGCPPRRPWPTGWAIRCSTPRCGFLALRRTVAMDGDPVGGGWGGRGGRLGVGRPVGGWQNPPRVGDAGTPGTAGGRAGRGSAPHRCG